MCESEIETSNLYSEWHSSQSYGNELPLLRIPVRADRSMVPTIYLYLYVRWDCFVHTHKQWKIKVEYSLELEMKILFKLRKGRHLGLATFIRRCYIRCIWWRSPFIKRCYERALWISYVESSAWVANRQANFDADHMSFAWNFFSTVCGMTQAYVFFLTDFGLVFMLAPQFMELLLETWID